ncbi:16S rRNA (guanine(966)-N(2))-methyltransferase RsmD [Gordonia sp. CPCC 205333]|uniref:16S rRNA (guanine(966)-N(2))-methyltransferase RsmD n=1 Tax=Gordonia sp. CPCC 205333 TaxID=3140790 RepID=UPI003AF3B8D2
MTRIIAGNLGGRRLTVGGEQTRPTSDRVREALFSMLEARIELVDAAVLDLYAGSGALGLEALSRGAAHTVFVESDRKAVAAIRANIGTCGVGDRTTLDTRSVLDFLSGSRPRFDLILADPPYGIDDDELTRTLIGLADLLAVDGLLVLERGKRSPQTRWPSGLAPIVAKNYGDTRVEVAARAD